MFQNFVYNANKLPLSEPSSSCEQLHKFISELFEYPRKYVSVKKLKAAPHVKINSVAQGERWNLNHLPQLNL